MPQKKALSVQSLACYGKCSLTEALPLISAQGISLSVLPTALLSTHTGGFGDPVKLDTTEFLRRSIEHFIKEKIYFDGVCTGYFSDNSQIEILLNNLEKINNGLFLCDPVLGDNGRLFSGINEDLIEYFIRLCQKADVITPNLTESYLLCGEAYNPNPSKAEIMGLALKLYNLTKANVVITGVELEDKIGCAVFNGSDFDLVSVRKQPQSFHGTGDMFASLLFGFLLNGKELSVAVSKAQDFILKAIKNTLSEKASERDGLQFEGLIKI